MSDDLPDLYADEDPTDLWGPHGPLPDGTDRDSAYRLGQIDGGLAALSLSGGPLMAITAHAAVHATDVEALDLIAMRHGWQVADVCPFDHEDDDGPHEAAIVTLTRGEGVEVIIDPIEDP